MTREEASVLLKMMFAFWANTHERNNVEMEMALNLALSALRTVSREQVEKAWMGCKYCDEEWGTCNPITNRFTMPPRGGIRFCPMCGRPLTDEAVDIVLSRLEVLKDGKSD